MGDGVGVLSEEMIDLCSSFDTTSEYEMSPHKSVRNSYDLFKNDITFNGSENISDLQTNDYTCNTNLNTSENSSFSITKKIEDLSLDHGPLPSMSKLREFKTVISEVNDAYVYWMISQFVIDSYKASEHKVPHQLAVKMNQVLTVATVQQCKYMRSKNGEKFNILGLDNNDIEAAINKSLTSLEKLELTKHTMVIVKDNVEQLSEQRKTLKGLFGVHCQKVVQVNTLLCEEREGLAKLYQCVQDQLVQASQLLIASNKIMHQLAHLHSNSEQQLKNITFTFLQDKAKYLHNVTSILKVKVDHSMHKDVNRTRAINSLGESLKTSMGSMSEQLKSLQKLLSKYETKEETSKKYREMVAEYAKTKRHLHHKIQTLNVLNDPDISFT